MHVRESFWDLIKTKNFEISKYVKDFTSGDDVRKRDALKFDDKEDLNLFEARLLYPLKYLFEASINAQLLCCPLTKILN